MESDNIQPIQFENTVKPVLTTTSEQRPPVNNDHPKSRPSNFSTKTPSEQRPPVNYGQRPPKCGLLWYENLSTTTTF